MNLSDAVIIAVISSVVSPLALQLLKMIWDWWKMAGENQVASKKTDAEINASFAKEWRELYENQEMRYKLLDGKYRDQETQNKEFGMKIAYLEVELQAVKRSHEVLRSEKDSLYREKTGLQVRVEILEHDIEGLRKAFEFLAHTVEGTYPEAVASARKLMKGIDN